jgi:hypothetical protein
MTTFVTEFVIQGWPAILFAAVLAGVLFRLDRATFGR